MPLLGTRGAASARGFGFLGGRASIGAPYWLGTLGGTGTDTGYSVAVNDAGDVYLCGRANSGAQFGYQLAKYSAAGVIQWQRKLGGTGSNSDEQGFSISLDAQSNCYVTGQSFNGDEYDVVTAKYNSAGTLQWQRQLQGDVSNDIGRGIAATTSGDVYVCGNSNSGGTNFLILAKYNTSGTIQWQRRLSLSGSAIIGRGVSVDSSGNVYVVGDRSQQYFEIAKYSSSGTLQWQRQFGVGSELGRAIAVDGSGNVYVCGRSDQPGTAYLQVAKYNTSGDIQWQRRLGTGSGGMDGFGVSVDSASNVYVTGQTFVNSNFDVFLAKYNTSGTIQWQRTLGSSGTDIGNGLFNDISGNLYLSAQTNVSGTVNFLFAKLPSDGSKTGTYTVGGFSFTYASTSLQDNSTSLETLSDVLTAGTSGITAGTSGLPSNTSTLTSAVTTI